MKQGAFAAIILIIALAIALIIFYGIFGKATEGTMLNSIYKGGPLVVALITISLMLVTYIVERLLYLNKAKGKKALTTFFAEFLHAMNRGDTKAATEACDAQQGAAGAVLKAGVEQYQLIKGEPITFEKKISEIQRAMDDAKVLEIPNLERNLVALSTIASIATLIGLLGTVIGMIRCFHAMAAQGGAPDALQLAQGISEALINTAGGLFAAILGIVTYNIFTTLIDNYSYQIEEASYSLITVIKSKEEK